MKFNDLQMIFTKKLHKITIQPPHLASGGWIFIGLIFFMAILNYSCNKSSETTYQYRLNFLTEEFKPLNYTENGALTGLAPELLRKICTQLNVPFDSKVLAWKDGYAQLQNDVNTVLYSTVLNSERRDLFKWAGPYASIDWLFYSPSLKQVALASLDDAKKVARIGVLKDYSIEQYLVSKGFTNLVYCTDNKDAFNKLLKGEIDLFPSDKITAEAALNSLGKSIYDVMGELTIRTDLIYFAFNKNIPDAVVADFQNAIDEMKTNGVLKSLYQKYMQSTDAPDILQVYTEQYPPITYRNSFGEITGFGTDIVKEIMKRNNTYYDIKLSLWSNGYELALNNPNFCLFTMDRTDLRKDLFKWVGPIGTNTTYLYTLAGSGITITSLQDAKKLKSIGTVNSWFSDQYLRDQGFSNLVSDSNPAVMTEKLISGKIDAFVCTSVTFPDILKSLGYLYNKVNPTFALMSSDYYIAFSKSTPDSKIKQWQDALDAAKKDGTYQAISNKWLK
jgi:ABC-type amino acid transport substrate-binding protein